MTRLKSLRILPLLAAIVAIPALAQTPVYAGADPAAQLSANLMILSQNPRDVNALLGAGQSAIAVGDGNAALSFLARAEEISPRDGRIKAALGTTLVMMERPSEALRLFADAVALGVAESQVAADRGLAYDLRGDSRRAQSDYQLAQRQLPSDEVTRRLALSLGISGDQKEALTLIDPLLRKQDQAAWRARAFILAMTGDVAGAEGVARSVMPVGSSDTMFPFLRRLPGLNAAERALAVNFGTMPSNGTRFASVETGDPFRPAGSGAGGGLIPAGEPLRRAEDVTPVRKAEVSKEPRRRPGREILTAGRPDARSEQRSSPPPKAVVRADTEIAIASPLPSSGRVGGRIGGRIGPVPKSATDQLPRPGFSVTPLETKTLPPPTRADLTDAMKTPGQAPTGTLVRDEPAKAAPLYIPQLLTSEPAGSAPVFEIPGAAASASAQPTAAPPAAVANATLVPSVVAAPVVSSFSLPRSQGSATAGAEVRSATPETVQSRTPVSQPSAQIAIATPAPSMPETAPVVAAPGLSGIAQIIATIEPEAESAPAALPSAEEIRAAKIAAQRKAEAKAKLDAAAKASKDAKDAEKLAAKAHPARIWVQIATGSNEAGLPSTWRKLRDKSPATFKGLGAASVPFKATNRLLVGPFRSQAEARALLNTMQKAGISGSTFASEAGQEVAKIAAR